jgi:hypothetical protein
LLYCGETGSAPSLLLDYNGILLFVAGQLYKRPAQVQLGAEKAPQVNTGGATKRKY